MGIGLSSVATARGYKTIIVMPDTMSLERRQIMKAYGVELVLTDGKKGMSGAIEKANELAKEIPNSFIPGQFENPNNPKAHRETTGPEIYEALDGNVDILVAGAGTGGTLTGIGEYLKSKNSNIKVIAVEPTESPILSEGKSGTHQIQGIGAGFIPKNLNLSIIDNIIKIDSKHALIAGNYIAKTEGFLVGISSGASYLAAIRLAKKQENKDKNIVVIFPDTGDRYLSTELYNQSKLTEKIISATEI